MTGRGGDAAFPILGLNRQWLAALCRVLLVRVAWPEAWTTARAGRLAARWGGGQRSVRREELDQAVGDPLVALVRRVDQVVLLPEAVDVGVCARHVGRAREVERRDDRCATRPGLVSLGDVLGRRSVLAPRICEAVLVVPRRQHVQQEGGVRAGLPCLQVADDRLQVRLVGGWSDAGILVIDP